MAIYLKRFYNTCSICHNKYTDFILRNYCSSCFNNKIDIDVDDIIEDIDVKPLVNILEQFSKY